jgi:chromosome segregation ATPase
MHACSLRGSLHRNSSRERRLKDRLHQLCLGRKSTTYTRTHYEHSTVDTACANRVLKDRMHRLRVAVISLRANVERRNAVIKSLERSLETLRVARAEELTEKDAAIEALQLRMQVAAARHNDYYNEVHQFRAAARRADASATEIEGQLPETAHGAVSASLGTASYASDEYSQRQRAPTAQAMQILKDMDQESSDGEL